MSYALAIGKNLLGKNHSVITEKLATQKLLLWQSPITNLFENYYISLITFEISLFLYEVRAVKIKT